MRIPIQYIIRIYYCFTAFFLRLESEKIFTIHNPFRRRLKQNNNNKISQNFWYLPFVRKFCLIVIRNNEILSTFPVKIQNFANSMNRHITEF